MLGPCQEIEDPGTGRRIEVLRYQTGDDSDQLSLGLKRYCVRYAHRSETSKPAKLILIHAIRIKKLGWLGLGSQSMTR